MDWKYLLKVVPEELTEEDKDELLNTIAWFDCSDGGLDFEKCKRLLVIGQEIMKYKSEQVEALLAELDEIARKQGEEEAKRQESDYDVRSMKSKASGGADLEDMEIKYRDLKMKYKKLQRIVEKTSDENEKLKQNVKMLEKERLHLQNELQHSHQDESASDISETVKDQHKNLIDNVHQKNAQISQLLTDIENVESDNLLLRKKLTNVRDELANATENIELLSLEAKVLKVKHEEMTETLEGLRLENEGLKSHINEIVDDKKQRETEFEEFAMEVDVRVEEWKKVLEEKNAEIANLKSRQSHTPTSHSTSSSSVKEDSIQLNALQLALKERDDQILELRTELETATKEMEESTEIIKKLSAERDACLKKYEKATLTAKDLKKQVKSVHNRCQELQEDVAYHENMVEMKTQEFQDLLQRINNGEHISDKETFSQLQDVKTQKILKEKQINDLVRTCNKLQGAVDVLEKENITLRERLGLNEDDYISTRSASSQQRKQRKLVEELKKEIGNLEEERLEFRMEVQKLSKIISNLSDQIIELGETPNPENVSVKLEETPPKPAKRTLLKEPEQKTAITDETVQHAKASCRNEQGDVVSSDQYKAVVEENEALRKGMHEILDSVHAKQETTAKEIKSETLEKLLRALDVKHISGWYHPAMRLQAELHALQGSNNELREQLRSTREQLENYKAKFPQTLLESMDSPTNESSALVIANLNKHLLKVLETYNNEEEINTTLTEKLDYYKNEFSIIQQQVILLYKQYFDEKQQWDNEMEETKKTQHELEEKNAVQDAKLSTISEYLDPKTDDDLKLKKAVELSAQLVVLNRKCVYLESQEADYRSQIAELKEDLLECEAATLKRMNTLGEENLKLTQKLKLLEAKMGYDTEHATEARNLCDDLVSRERKLLKDLSEIHKVNENQLNLLTRRVDLLEDEKRELEKRLLDTLQRTYATGDKNMDALAKKLSQSEVNETAERQRANHTNNLYELVKEQLQKSEERHKDYQKYNNEIMHKNLILQESVKELENKVFNYIDLSVFKSLENQYLDVLKQKDALVLEKTRLENELNSTKKCNEMRRLWVDLERQEFLHLRHQIVDLQAAGDDKSVIARLSSDVVTARMVEAETRRKYEDVLVNLNKCCLDKDRCEESFEKDRNHLQIVKEGLEKKVRHLEMIIRQQRHHYIGYIPLVSEYKFAEKIREIYEAKKLAYDHLQQAQEIKNDCELLKNTWEAKNNILNELNTLVENRDENGKLMEKWYQDKNNIQLQELRYKKQAEFKESQLLNANQRLLKQEEQIANLELELLQSICIKEDNTGIEKPVRDLKKSTATIVEIKPEDQKLCKVAETQTLQELQDVGGGGDASRRVNILEEELKKTKEESDAKVEMVHTMKQRITELEMSLSLFRQQIGDKQSQITFYEKHIMDMQQSKKEHADDSAISTGDSVSEDSVKLKFQSTIRELQDAISEKESTILEYQSLLKKDRDEHSLAAARFQEEIKNLQAQASAPKDSVSGETHQLEPHPSRAAIEHYILQVHALEKHTAELHTSVASLNSQLQASRQEAVRWRSLAYDRLQNMEELRVGIEEHHQNELIAYKNESEKWREEVMSLQQFISKYKKDITDLRPDIEKEIKDKDNKIHELTVTLRQLRNNLRRKPSISQPTSSRDDNFEEVKENLVREHDVLKKRYEQLLNREKNAREEIRTLKGQLMRRPLLSARSDNSVTKEQQLQKKITAQDKEIEELREKLEHEAALNEAHKTKVNEDFERWSKQKFWQQNAEKLKGKLKEKHEELEKSQQTCSGYRMLISRLEREKHNLEIRLKSMKTNTTNVQVMRHEMLEVENGKLMLEVDKLRSRLEMQQRHAGGLGAAMLEEKLEAQERKIAVLEMSARGGGELRAELERLQASHAVLQKSNLRLEAENLELRLDLEKSCNELPHLREQIVHLESYIGVLKAEKEHHEVSSSGDHPSSQPPENAKRVAELERTVFVLKRIVEKLQVENKRLQGGSRPCSDRVGSAERIKRENRRLKEQHSDCTKRISQLEKELETKNKSPSEISLRAELEELRAQLRHKSELLDKVKVLLQKAAGKEKALLEQVTALKSMIPRDARLEELPE